MDEYLKKRDVLWRLGITLWEKYEDGQIAKDVINDIKPADVVPVTHAQWIDHTEEADAGYWECSSCGKPWLLIEGTPAENEMNYCPRCGAKMEEE